MNSFPALPNLIPCLLDTLGLQAQIEAGIAECKEATADSIADCIETFSSALSNEIRDCGNAGP